MCNKNTHIKHKWNGRDRNKNKPKKHKDKAKNNNKRQRKMVKNTKGGSGHKRFARKNTNDSAAAIERLIYAENPGEVYAVATKMLGNGMFYAKGIDSIPRLVHIRGRFSAGHKRRDNMVVVGGWVLIGLRDWETSSSSSSSSSSSTSSTMKIQHADLLEVYSDLDKIRLRETRPSEPWSILTAAESTSSSFASSSSSAIGGALGDDDVVFMSAADEEREQYLAEMKKTREQDHEDVDKSTRTTKTTTKTTGQQVINIDDI